ncbi:TrbI/VirB10 family protein [Sphingomonas sp. UYP23]
MTEVDERAVEERPHERETVEEGAPPKLDPEAMVLRAKPSRAIRFKRQIIIGGAALAVIVFVAVGYIALRPAVVRMIHADDERAVAGKGTPDALNALPDTYGTAPKLGPPLPGDLGRGILERQRSMPPQDAMGEGAKIDQAEVTARERRDAEIKSARESGLIVQSGNRTAAVEPVASPNAAPTATEPVKVATDSEHDPNGQQRKSDFVGAQDKGGDVNPHALIAARSPYMLSAGSVIAASLITGLRSDLPGLVTAQITERVYDSATGRILLIPQGARLIGSYDSVVAFGQRNALVVWQRIIMPDGSSLQIDNVPAADPSGYAGLKDKVDFHTWALLKGVALSTLLGVGSSLTVTGESDLVQAIRESTQQNVSRAGDQLTSRNLQIQPTITIRPGAPVRLVVHRDLIFAPPGSIGGDHG